MNLSLGQGAILTYLAAVLLLGGAGAAGFGANGLLEIAGAGLMAWIWWKRPGTAATRTGLRLFLAALALIAAIQFLPLPPALWTLIPGRAAIASGFELARMPLPWLTLSLDPWSTLQSLVWWIPALALFMAMRSSDAPSTRHAVWVIAAVAYASVLVAGLQVYQNTGYVYTVTNRGNGVGAFSNSNHFGTFMLMAIALIAAQWLHDSRDNGADKKALARPLQLSIPGFLTAERDHNFDDERLRSAGIRLLYPELNHLPAGIKSGILLEAGFDQVSPNRPCLISS